MACLRAIEVSSEVSAEISGTPRRTCNVLGRPLVEGLASVFDVADAAAGLVDGFALTVAVVCVVDRSDDCFRDAPHGDQ